MTRPEDVIRPYLRVLVVEDNPSDAELMIAALRDYGYDVAARVVTREHEFDEAIDNHDLVLCDHNLPEFSTTRALQRLQARGVDVPLIVVSGALSEDGAVELVREGAEDYLLKDRLTRLGAAVHSAIERRATRRAVQADRKRAEARYRATFEQPAVGIAHVARDWAFVEVNRKLAEMLGYAPEALERLRVFDVIHPDDHAATKLVLEELLRDPSARSSLSCEVRFLRGDGGTGWASVAMSVAHPAHEQEYFVAIVLDVTRRKWAEARASLLQSTVIALSEAHDVHEALLTVLRQICELTGWPFGQAWLPTVEGRHMKPAVAWHTGTERLEQFYRQSAEIVLDERGGGLASQVYQTCTPLRLENLAGSRLYRREAALACGFTSWIGVPVVADGRTVALLEFFLPEARDEHADQLELIAVVARQVGILIQRKAARDELAFIAHHDGLTGLPNRALFLDRLRLSLAQAQRSSTTVAVLAMDVDQFGTLNDALGHAAGDELLRQVGERIATCLRSADTLARVGGDEFAVVLSELAAPQDAAVVAQKILTALSAPFELDGTTVYSSASIGIALSPLDGVMPDALLRSADGAMYGAKAAGRARCQFYTAEMNQRAMERLQLQQNLRKALDRDEFYPVYQPKVDVRERKIVGFEVLLRWRNQGALVAPSVFVPILEESGLIVPVGRWLLRTVCLQLRKWMDAGLPAVPVAVNVSAQQLESGSLLEDIEAALTEFRVGSDLLQLEITESSVIKRAEEAMETLGRLRARGLTVAMDDFGTGYSSLGYLRRLPIDIVKIDRTFITDLPTNAEAAAIARAVIEMAHSLGLIVVAEGVETEAQVSWLEAQGCDQLQGFLFSPPLEAGDAAQLLTGVVSGHSGIHVERENG